MDILKGYSFEVILLARILLAYVSGLLIGYERESKNKFAGIRTHIIVALGSCLGVILSKYGFSMDGASNDTSRVAAQIISGIGFLGTGVIFVRGDIITGLTTAAGIWTTAVISMCFGAGMYLFAIITTILVLITQRIFEKVDITHVKVKDIITIRSTNKDIWREIERYISRQKIKYKVLYRTYSTNGLELSIEYYARNEEEFNEFIIYVSSFKYIERVEIKHVQN